MYNSGYTYTVSHTRAIYQVNYFRILFVVQRVVEHVQFWINRQGYLTHYHIYRGLHGVSHAYTVSGRKSIRRQIDAHTHFWASQIYQPMSHIDIPSLSR